MRRSWSKSTSSSLEDDPSELEQKRTSERAEAHHKTPTTYLRVMQGIGEEAALDEALIRGGIDEAVEEDDALRTGVAFFTGAYGYLL